MLARVPIADTAQHTFTVALADDGVPANEDDDRRRFKVVVQEANVISLDSIVAFCEGKPQSEQAMELMYTAIQAVNVLLREEPTKHYTPVGAAGRRFFGMEGNVEIASGGVVCKGFMQSFRPTVSGLPAVQVCSWLSTTKRLAHYPSTDRHGLLGLYQVGSFDC